MKNTFRDVFLVAAKRTPVGAFQGSLSSVSATTLGSEVVKAILEETKISLDSVDEVIMGCVLSAGLGQAPARQVALRSGLSNSVECLTINKMCGSGLKAVMLASQAIKTEDADLIIAGGMENMTRSPYLIPKGRDGLRLGHGKIIDSMIGDGLWDVYNDKHMGNCAETCATDRNYDREDQDAFAIESYTRAQKAQADGLFDEEMIPVSVPRRKGDDIIVEVDDEPNRANFDKMKSLRPAFDRDGTITAANASKINDGAAAVLVASEKKVQEYQLKPMAKIISQASAAHDPEWFTTAPSKAIAKALSKANIQADDIDLWEINEAFAPVALAAIEDFNLDREKVNVHGGAIALGHPIGASGARVLTTLLHAMENRNANRGLATLCIGGGEAVALIVEKVL